jgi:hypothetical protein
MLLNTIDISKRSRRNFSRDCNSALDYVTDFRDTIPVMNVVYLDLNVVIDLVERNAGNSQIEKARGVILTLANARHTSFPYSEVHQWESRGMPADKKRHIGEFWDRISCGYRFMAGKDIRSLQFKDVLHGRKTRFSPRLVVFPHRFRFADLVGDIDPVMQSIARQQFRAVVERWASLTQQEIDRHVRKEEAATMSRMVLEMFTRILNGELPSEIEIFSEYNTIASDLAWELRARGEGDDTFLKAVAFMRDHALEVPAMGIESVGLECLARQYAIDNERVRAVTNSQLDHDCNDLAAISNFVPYCAGAISDGNAVNLARTAYKKIDKVAPTLFTRRELGEFTDFLEQLPSPGAEPNPESELARSTGRTLFVIAQRKNELIGREAFSSIRDIKREILPFGGLKVWSEHADWPNLLAALESLADETKEEFGGEAVLYGGQVTGGVGEIKFSLRVPIGSLNLCRDEIESAFASVGFPN